MEHEYHHASMYEGKDMECICDTLKKLGRHMVPNEDGLSYEVEVDVEAVPHHKD